MAYLIYRLADGLVSHRYSGPESHLEQNTWPDFSALPCGDEDSDATHRVDITATPHAVIAKTAIDYLIDKISIDADGVDAAILSGLPANCTASLGDMSVSETGGEIPVVIDLPGSYEIILSHPLYLDTHVTITAS